MRSVAVHSTADADALHVRFADEKVCIGPPPARQSYLNIPAIISAAEISGADSVHPGYGFLAENAHFAEVVQRCGLHWIGPQPEVMRIMGDKVSARKLMSDGRRADPARHRRHRDRPRRRGGRRAHRLPGHHQGLGGRRRPRHEDRRGAGSPVDAAGAGALRGAGRLRQPGGLHRALHRPAAPRRGAGAGRRQPGRSRSASASARSSAATRSWSRRRRRSALDGRAPRRAAGRSRARRPQAIGYKTVGTLEFLLDEDKRFYFMEMNTRIQVEHTVTEEVFGVDLVREQMRLAAGEPLRIGNDIRPRGHAIELRINAEDPVTFAPSPGRITALNLPGGPRRARRHPHLHQLRRAAVLRLAAGQADRPRREPARRPWRACGARWRSSSSRAARPTSTFTAGCCPTPTSSAVAWTPT